MADETLAAEGASDDTELLAKLAKWAKECDEHWSQWKKDAKDWFGITAGDQWDKDDEDKLKAQDRVPVTFNRVGPIIDAVSGAEIVGRQEVQYFPREVGDTAVNEVLTKGAEWIRDRSDADQEESDAFRDAFICGLGYTETRMDYEEEVEGQILIERLDPLSVDPDPKARKPNLTDARYFRRKRPFSEEEYESRWPDKPLSTDGDSTPNRSVRNPGEAYNGDNDEESVSKGDIIVSEWQWYDLEPVHVVEHPVTKALVELTPEQFEQFNEQLKATPNAAPPRSAKRNKRVYYRAYVAGGVMLEPVAKLPDGEFTIKAITGKRDRNKGTWYGLVKGMADPQRWANKFFSQILHIINSNAKGGNIIEADAIEDIKKFEEDWAKPDANVVVTPGALSRGAIQPKPQPPYPQGIDRLMEMSVTAIRDTTGVNQEILGMVERDQPGVLEAQRKQAAYGILASFFDSFRRYRKLQGRLLLKYIQHYVPANTLVRIIGEDGTAKNVPLALQGDVAKYDVVVDEAPAGPNQKATVWNMIVQLMPLLKGANLPPEVWAEFVRYSPFPDALGQKISQALMKAAQPTPEKQRAQELGVAAEMAKVDKDKASAERDRAEAVKTDLETRLMVTQPAVPPMFPNTGMAL